MIGCIGMKKRGRLYLMGVNESLPFVDGTVNDLCGTVGHAARGMVIAVYATAVNFSLNLGK